MILFFRSLPPQSSSSTFQAVWAKRAWFIGWTTIRLLAIRPPILRSRPKTSATSSSSPKRFQGPSTIFGCTIRTPPTIRSRGLPILPQVSKTSSYRSYILIHFLCISVPDPPSGLSVYVRSGKQAIVSWSPPSQGSYTSFKLKINPLVHIPGEFQLFNCWTILLN